MGHGQSAILKPDGSENIDRIDAVVWTVIHNNKFVTLLCKVVEIIAY